MNLDQSDLDLATTNLDWLGGGGGGACVHMHVCVLVCVCACMHLGMYLFWVRWVVATAARSVCVGLDV